MGRSVAESQLVFVILLVVVIAFATLARRVQQPYPIVLVLAGLVVSLIPGLPKVMLDPDIIFFVVLPPLLYAAAWTTSWRDFSYNLVSISSLAIGLVGFTVAGVALAAPFLLGGLAVGFLVGAAVHWVEKRIDDGPIEIAIGILVPYAAYLLAGGLRASGVLAVVTAGLYLSRKSSQMFSPRVRIQTYAV